METVFNKLKVRKTLLLTYIVIYFTCGMIMQNIGIYFKIAKFQFWWQIITCYLFYMVPISIVLRNKNWLDQYAYGVVAIGFLELCGYAIGSSIAFDGNFIERLFGTRNFTLSMTIFFGTYFPLGNFSVSYVENLVFKTKSLGPITQIAK